MTTNDDMTPRQPDEDEPFELLPGDELDLVDETVARITDAEVNEHLRKVLSQSGYTGQTVRAAPALDGFADPRPADLVILADQDRIYAMTVRQLRLHEQAAVLDEAIAIIGREAKCVAAEGITAADPLREPAINPEDEADAIGYRRADDKRGPGEQGTRRASHRNWRPAARLAIPVKGRLAIAVAAAAAAVAAAAVTGSVPPVSAPPVTGPTIKTASLITSMSDTVLFTSDRTDLTSSADTLLLPLAQLARSQHLAVSITGYASPGGSDVTALALSALRAAAVRDQLIALGLPPDQITHVTGKGASVQSLDACRLDETRCAGLRRVVIVLSPEAPRN